MSYEVCSEDGCIRVVGVAGAKCRRHREGGDADTRTELAVKTEDPRVARPEGASASSWVAEVVAVTGVTVRTAYRWRAGGVTNPAAKRLLEKEGLI